MSALQDLKDYNDAQRRLAAHFGLDGFWYNLRDCTDEDWGELESGPVYGLHLDSEGNFEDYDYGGDGIYGTSRWETEELTLFTVYTGFGDKEMQIFSNDRKVPLAQG